MAAKDIVLLMEQHLKETDAEILNLNGLNKNDRESIVRLQTQIETRMESRSRLEDLRQKLVEKIDKAKEEVPKSQGGHLG